MRLARDLLLGILLVPAGAGAQSPHLLGLYDDAAMTSTTGVASGPTKDIYLGIRFGNQSIHSLTGIEFSIEGLDPFYVTVTAMHDPATVKTEKAAGVASNGFPVNWLLGSVRFENRSLRTPTVTRGGPLDHTWTARVNAVDRREVPVPSDPSSTCPATRIESVFQRARGVLGDDGRVVNPGARRS